MFKSECSGLIVWNTVKVSELRGQGGGMAKGGGGGGGGGNH